MKRLAPRRAKARVTGDHTQPTRDRYGRLLAYVKTRTTQLNLAQVRGDGRRYSSSVDGSYGTTRSSPPNRALVRSGGECGAGAEAVFTIACDDGAGGRRPEAPNLRKQRVADLMS